MKLKDLTKEDLDTMSYEELAQLILSDANTQMKIIDIFKKKPYT